MRRVAFILIALLGVCLNLVAQESDSTSLRPTFGVNFTAEMQTDFKNVRYANLLELHADIPLSRSLSFQASSLSAMNSRDDLDILDLQGFSNIDTPNMPFALAVAGFSWHPNDRHSLFAGIRRTDEDYFCSEGLSLFTNSSCGIFPTSSYNSLVPCYPNAALGVHYAYDHKNLCLQASLYNGIGNNQFYGRYNVFRFCPKSDGVMAIGQAEYRYRNSHYYLGGIMHSKENISSSVWAYAEQSLSPRLTLLAAYGHAFGSKLCDNFCALGATYKYKRAEFGLFSDYTRIVFMDEWATELICSLRLTDILTVKPVLHIITTNGETKCVGVLRMDIGI